MNRYIRLAILGTVVTGISAGAAYEGTRYGYDTGKAQGIALGKEAGTQQGKDEITNYVIKTCESGSDVMLIFKDKQYYCLTESQFEDLVQVIAEKAIEAYRRQGGHHGAQKAIPGI